VRQAAEWIAWAIFAGAMVTAIGMMLANLWRDDGP
jgi:hypothetical protein